MVQISLHEGADRRATADHHAAASVNARETCELTILMPCLNEAETLATLHRQGAQLPDRAAASSARC